MELASIPPGNRLVPEAERIKYLTDLIEVKNEIINALERFPIITSNVSRSQSTQAAKLKLEEKLIKVNKTIKIFERPPVYLAI